MNTMSLVVSKIKTKTCNILSFCTSYNSKKNVLFYTVYLMENLFYYFSRWIYRIFLEDRWITYILKLYVTAFLGKFACFEELDILGIYEREYTTRKSPISTLV